MSSAYASKNKKKEAWAYVEIYVIGLCVPRNEFQKLTGQQMTQTFRSRNWWSDISI